MTLPGWYPSLPEPPLPPDLPVRALDDHHWGVRDFDPMTHYLLRPSVLDDLLAGDQLAVSHAGHGVNSYAITYALAWRGLVVLAEVFDACGTLIEAAARRTGDRTLVCVESRLRDQSLCGWHPEIVPAAPGTALTAALDLLN